MRCQVDTSHAYTYSWSLCVTLSAHALNNFSPFHKLFYPIKLRWQGQMSSLLSSCSRCQNKTASQKVCFLPWYDSAIAEAQLLLLRILISSLFFRIILPLISVTHAYFENKDTIAFIKPKSLEFQPLKEQYTKYKAISKIVLLLDVVIVHCMYTKTNWNRHIPWANKCPLSGDILPSEVVIKAGCSRSADCVWGNTSLPRQRCDAVKHESSYYGGSKSAKKWQQLTYSDQLQVTLVKRKIIANLEDGQENSYLPYELRTKSTGTFLGLCWKSRHHADIDAIAIVHLKI